ncbi:signal peptidase I protein [Wolfiporia cocos MD-104 SS10]|uniref:Signal peptidase I protein n=1 Tax=Wolfiporia cocos (strain MD-104) TaxID=742152 RepID=A0A2H3IVQ5_WOLCO|nr:signal peptidase I protein [Wolfiporia cocos MD-104 SS10]
MLPTMSVSGELVIENKMISPEHLSRGDLVTFTSPLDPSRIVCKRLIGLPGDVICVDPTGQLAPSTEHVLVPRNHIWVSGDNAAFSRDSRMYGPVSMALIRGRLVAKIWPPTEATVFRNNFNYID